MQDYFIFRLLFVTIITKIQHIAPKHLQNASFPIAIEKTNSHLFTQHSI